MVLIGSSETQQLADEFVLSTINIKRPLCCQIWYNCVVAPRYPEPTDLINSAIDHHILAPYFDNQVTNKTSLTIKILLNIHHHLWSN